MMARGEMYRQQPDLGRCQGSKSDRPRWRSVEPTNGGNPDWVTGRTMPQNCYDCGKIIMQTFLDSLPIA
jgi:hypothetical protein